MKISVVTVVFNGEKFLEECLRSVQEQTHPEVEHIVIDGGSKDGTLEIIHRNKAGISKWISEKDKGIYDAINKGLALATGDVIGILNSDDRFAHPRVLERIAKEFDTCNPDTVFGELVYVHPDNDEKVTRYYSPRNFRIQHFRKGDMPPHPTFYAKREMFKQFGNFKDDYRICADFEWMIRVLYKGKASWRFIPEVMVKMRTGGISTSGIRSTILVNKEMLRACRENHVPTSILRIYSKYFTKFLQLFQRPKESAKD